ncbi:MAG: hypothetical protein M3Q56_01595, partial [Bacteroidota bacterium]|nr:hypothetical protein [Bacteroidota bacterium]
QGELNDIIKSNTSMNPPHAPDSFSVHFTERHFVCLSICSHRSFRNLQLRFRFTSLKDISMSFSSFTS